eukprot:gene9837-7722_t
MQVRSLGGSGETDAVKPSSLNTVKSIVAKNGLRGLFRGLSINYMKVVPSTAIGFTVYDQLKAVTLPPGPLVPAPWSLVPGPLPQGPCPLYAAPCPLVPAPLPPGPCSLVPAPCPLLPAPWSLSHCS